VSNFDLDGPWLFRPPRSPKCPYCGEIGPYSEEERYEWIHRHTERWPHRWWWRLRKLVFLGP
jgi:hypothetical protein